MRNSLAEVARLGRTNAIASLAAKRSAGFNPRTFTELYEPEIKNVFITEGMPQLCLANPTNRKVMTRGKVDSVHQTRLHFTAERPGLFKRYLMGRA